MEWIKEEMEAEDVVLSDNNNPSEAVCYIEDHRNTVEVLLYVFSVCTSRKMPFNSAVTFLELFPCHVAAESWPRQHWCQPTRHLSEAKLYHEPLRCQLT